MEYLRKCTHCGKEAYNEEDMLLFKKDKTMKYGHANTCLKCNSEVFYHSRKHLKEKKESYKKSDIKKKYGITLEEYNDAMSTSDSCEICGVNVDLCYDHNHDTNKFRGVLCRKCNRGLGFFNDNKDIVEKAFNYLSEKGDYGTD